MVLSRTGDCNRSAMQFDNVFGDGQPQPQTFGVIETSLDKRVEDTRQEILFDSDAGISNGYRVFLILGGNRDRPRPCP